MKRETPPPAPRRPMLAASVIALLGLVLVVACFAGYLTPAALLSLLSGSAFCG